MQMMSEVEKPRLLILKSIFQSCRDLAPKIAEQYKTQNSPYSPRFTFCIAMKVLVACLFLVAAAQVTKTQFTFQ